jgi:hypothetical protein
MRWAGVETTRCCSVELWIRKKATILEMISILASAITINFRMCRRKNEGGGLGGQVALGGVDGGGYIGCVDATGVEGDHDQTLELPDSGVGVTGGVDGDATR